MQSKKIDIDAGHVTERELHLTQLLRLSAVPTRQTLLDELVRFSFFFLRRVFIFILCFNTLNLNACDAVLQ